MQVKFAILVAVLVNTLATFRSDYEHEIGYEYDFRISKQLCSQSLCSSMLLTSRERCHRNNNGGTDDNLKPTARN